MGHQIGWGLMLVLAGRHAQRQLRGPHEAALRLALGEHLAGLLGHGIADSPLDHRGGHGSSSWRACFSKLPAGCWPRLPSSDSPGALAAVLFGQGIARVGLALGFAVILGITSSFGSLLPLAILHPDQLGTRHGVALIAGTLVMIVGLVFLALAGKRREREQASATAASEHSGFGVGLIICILSGVFSSMLNFAFVFGEEMRQLSLHAGASTAMSGNAIWALAVSCGFLPNAAYCIYLLNKNHTWGVFQEKAAGADYTLGATLMGFLWYSGVVVYGMGADALGALGGIVGWPVYMSVDIIAGIAWGFLGGEWKGASRTALGYCLTGIAILFLAIGVISLGNAS